MVIVQILETSTDKYNNSIVYHFMLTEFSLIMMDNIRLLVIYEIQCCIISDEANMYNARLLHLSENFHRPLVEL